MDYERRLAALTEWLSELLEQPPVLFSMLTPSMIPAKGGVYLISLRSSGQDEVVYAGTTSKLSQRVYNNHLHGDRNSSQLKNALVHHGLATDFKSAKDHALRYCAVRYDVRARLSNSR